MQPRSVLAPGAIATLLIGATGATVACGSFASPVSAVDAGGDGGSDASAQDGSPPACPPDARICDRFDGPTLDGEWRTVLLGGGILRPVAEPGGSPPFSLLATAGPGLEVQGSMFRSYLDLGTKQTLELEAWVRVEAASAGVPGDVLWIDRFGDASFLQHFVQITDASVRAHSHESAKAEPDASGQSYPLAAGDHRVRLTSSELTKSDEFEVKVSVDGLPVSTLTLPRPNSWKTVSTRANVGVYARDATREFRVRFRDLVFSAR